MASPFLFVVYIVFVALGILPSQALKKKDLANLGALQTATTVSDEYSLKRALERHENVVAYGYIDKVSVKVNDRVSIKIFSSKDGLNCTRTIKEDDNINEWSQG